MYLTPETCLAIGPIKEPPVLSTYCYQTGTTDYPLCATSSKRYDSVQGFRKYLKMDDLGCASF